ncbi:MAG: protoporphyrinogen oxidase [Mariprofundaceae bacterium]
MDHQGKQVVIIGAGISGLSTAFWLRQKGIEATVLERSGRVGGVIRSEKINGYTIDHAANCLMNFLPEVNHLCATVGLSDQRVFRRDKARQRYLLKNGRPRSVPLSPKDMLTSSFWPWRAKLRMAMEPFIPASRPDTEETVADFIRRRFGKELLDQAIDPFVAGTLAGDPEQACARSTMPKFYEFEQNYGSILRGVVRSKLAGTKTRCPMRLFSFHNGMESLPAAIGQYLGEQVRTDAKVQGVERRGRRWRIEAICDGQPVEMEADSLVMATPAAAAADLLRPVSGLVADQLSSITYTPMAVMMLGFRTSDVGHQLDGIGCLIPKREGKHLLGTLWNSSLFAERAPEGRVLITCYLGGLRHPEAIGHGDGKLLELAMADLRPMLGIKGQPEFVRVIRHRQGLPQYHLGHQQRLATIREQLQLTPGLYLCGNYLDGVSVRDCVARGRQLAARIASAVGRGGKLSLVPAAAQARRRAAA